MQIVIDILEEDFEIMKHNIAVNNPLCPLSQKEMVSKVANGTPLPKGHGRLIDAEILDLENLYRENDDCSFSIVYTKSEFPTIIEAESEEEC